MTKFKHLFVGFDELLNQMEDFGKSVPSFPFYNIKKAKENRYIIELAVAGFTKEDLAITLERNRLVVKGEITEEDTSEYVHKGLAFRPFERVFNLSEKIVVKDAEFINGILRITLDELVETPKVKKVKIS